MKKTRRQTLEEFLSENPSDAFARYGLALECAKEGANQEATEHFRTLVAAHPDYVAGYFQFGQFLARVNQNEEARAILLAGIDVARKAGDSHAQSEMEAALGELV